jgi:uncharacterized protein DUF5946
MADLQNPSLDRCSGCGLVVAGGTAGCRRIFDDLLARDFSDVAYFRVHRMFVDTYSLQHPDEYCASAKSFAAHLTGLCWQLERDGSRAVGGEPRRWLNGSPRLDRPEAPVFRGRLTIADIRDAPDGAAHADAVDRWARSTWEAYAALHPLARRWIEDALAAERR